MSSSEPPPAPKPFLAGFLGGFVALLASAAAAMLVIDPLGAAAADGICPAGPKSGAARISKMLIVQRVSPRTAVLGTSRVAWAFERDSIALLGPTPSLNLGISNGLPADWAALSEQALAGGRLRRAYLGVDFGIRHEANENPPAPPFSASRWPAAERLRQAYLSYDALRALPQAILDCRARFHGDGTPVLGPGERSPGTHVSYGDQARLVTTSLRRSARRVDSGSHAFAERRAALRTTIAELRRRDVEVVLFSAPYRDELVAIFERTGWGNEFSAFHEDLERLAREQGVPFVDFHDSAGLSRLRLPPCPGGGIGCHYTDLTHYRPLVAERMAPLLRRAADEFDWTRP